MHNAALPAAPGNGREKHRSPDHRRGIAPAGYTCAGQSDPEGRASAWLGLTRGVGSLRLPGSTAGDAAPPTRARCMKARRVSLCVGQDGAAQCACAPARRALDRRHRPHDAWHDWPGPLGAELLHHLQRARLIGERADRLSAQPLPGGPPARTPAIGDGTIRPDPGCCFGKHAWREAVRLEDLGRGIHGPRWIEVGLAGNPPQGLERHHNGVNRVAGPLPGY